MEIGGIKLQKRLSDSLLLFYIAIATNFLVYLFPKDHIDFIKNNFFVRHLFGLVTIMFSIYHISDITQPFQVILFAIVLYAWFLMTTRLPPIYDIIIILLLVTSFMINMKIDSIKRIDYSNEAKEQLKQLNRLTLSIFLFAIILSTIGYIYTFL